MTLRQYIFLALLGLAVVMLVASFQHSPGYMDADSYYAGGLQLDAGHGFTEPYIWNYLDDPIGLPHPSNSYWMPLTSILAAIGLSVLEPSSWISARFPFLLVAALIPPITASLAWNYTSRSDLAIISGLLAVFPVFYLPFLPVTDTFGIYILLGGLFFLLFKYPRSSINSIFIGLVAGLMHLARADGLLWLLFAWFAFLIFHKPNESKSLVLNSILFTLVGYLLVMTPWYIRNLATFGQLIAPGGSKALWLTSYDQMFSYPASQISISKWWQSGLSNIIQDRIWSLGLNLSNLVSVQGEIFLLPLIGIGFWHLRKQPSILLAGMVFMVILVVMTLIFPFAGARGGYFHSGASLQSVWWALAPVGLDRFIAWGARKRGWNEVKAGRVFKPTLVSIAVLLTAIIVYGRVIGAGGLTWDWEYDRYNHISDFLSSHGMNQEAVVMTANPPGFYLASGRQAVAVPDGKLDTVLIIAVKYKVDFLILEMGRTPTGLLPVYENPKDWTDLVFLGEMESARIFFIPR